jgi:hypothetical protein
MENTMFAFVDWLDWALPYIFSIMAILGLIAAAIGRYFYTDEDWQREDDVVRRLNDRRRRERMQRRG